MVRACRCGEPFESVMRSLNLNPVHIGTAGWSIPRAVADLFSGPGLHLERYSRTFKCAEINSSFYRPHRPSTYVRWADSTPEGFLFSVKVPKTITHESALAPTREQLKTFLDEAAHLGNRLGPLLFQLPPKQSFEPAPARAFFELFRNVYPRGQAVLEPRHTGWFTPEATRLLQEHRISRVIADPPRAPASTSPSDDPLIYYRLHGSPRTYYSSYSPEYIRKLASDIATRHASRDVWCIFDNTASGAAAENALSLTRELGDIRPGKRNAS